MYCASCSRATVSSAIATPERDGTSYNTIGRSVAWAMARTWAKIPLLRRFHVGRHRAQQSVRARRHRLLAQSDRDGGRRRGAAGDAGTRPAAASTTVCTARAYSISPDNQFVVADMAQEVGGWCNSRR